MKLSQLFSGEVRSDAAASRSSQLTPAQAELTARHIRSLVPGQTISGEIVSRNGSEVQIRISEDILINARVDRNLNIEVGKNMTFEVKNNGSALTLSPLFTNVATDMTVLKALDMAGLPVNRMSIDMTQQLMSAGMSVSRSSLQQIFREINSYAQSEISDIINLHRLQMPVNEANLNQMAAYRNLNHQLTQGMDAILEALPEAFDSMTAQGDTAGAVKLYQEVLQLVSEESGMEAPGETAVVPGQDAVQGNPAVPGQVGPQEGSLPSGDGTFGMPGEAAGPGQVFTEGAAGTPIPAVEAGEAGETEPLRGEETGNLQRGIPDQTPGEQPAAILRGGAVPEAEAVQQNLRTAAAGEALELLDSLRMPPGDADNLRMQLLQFASGEADTGAFFSALNKMAANSAFSSVSTHLLEKIFSGTKFRNLLSAQLKNNWMLRPEEVASPGKVEEMYRRLDRQLRSLGTALEEAGQSGSTAYRAVSSMSQNIDFLQQLNQMYTYVQLPLRLQQRDAQGELYVYTNKKKMTSQDGTVSALLHLDMDHLGPVDVYVSMKRGKVATRFYLRDDETIDFMSQHMDTLTRRLQERGYDCSFSMTLREAEKGGEATQGGLEPVLRQNKGIMLSHYAFDVRT